MRKSGMRLVSIAAAVVVMSCSGRGDRPVAVEQWEAEPPIAGAWLRERLPAETAAYLRIPHPLGLLAMPKGGMLDTVLGSAANMGALERLRRGLVDNVLAQTPAASNPLVALAVDKLESPIEIAALGPPVAGVLVGATLDFNDAAALEDWLATGGLGQVGIALAEPLGDDGSAELRGLPVPAHLHFDAATRRVLVLAAPEATADMLAQLTAAPPAPEHAMRAAEARIDSSGQGLFAWVDLRRSLSLAQGMGFPAGAAQLGPLASANAVALGAGNANGKGRLALLVEMADDATARPFPVVENALTATAAGEVDGLALLSIPSRDELARLEALVLSGMPLPQRSGWAETKTAFRDATGIEIEEIVSAIGPELLMILDSAGDYGALRLRDAALFDDIMRRIASRVGSAPAERSVGGTTVSHWTLPATSFLPAAAADEVEQLGALGEILGRMATHLYWTRDGDYVYFANVPQPLLDRARSSSPTDVGAWLRDTQRFDASSSLFAATGSIPKVPRRIYYSYVGFMQTLADVAGTELDLLAFPTADDLALPPEGAIGFAVNFGDPYVSLELSYEVHPGELLFAGGGVASMAALGFVAAIAIPAYQDYTTRATVGAGLDQAGAAQVQVGLHVQRTGRLPNDDEAEALTDELAVAPPVDFITVEGDTGVVVVDFLPGTVSGEGQLWLTPELAPDGRTVLSWSCEAAILPKHLPASCR